MPNRHGIAKRLAMPRDRTEAMTAARRAADNRDRLTEVKDATAWLLRVSRIRDTIAERALCQRP